MNEQVSDYFLGDFVRKLCLQQVPVKITATLIYLKIGIIEMSFDIFYSYLSTEDYKIHI